MSSEDTLFPLTPIHFLRLRDIGVTDDVEIDLSKLSVTVEDLVTRVWKINSVVKTFWQKFVTQYLLALQQTHTVGYKNPKGSVSYAPTLGTAVLIKEDLAPQARWPMSVIEKVDARGATANIRINTVKANEVKSKVVQQPVSRLYPF